MGDAIKKLLNKVADGKAEPEVFVPEYESQGHYSTNIALRLASIEKKKPLELAEELKNKIQKSAPKGFFDKVEVAAPGFINFWISKGTLQKEFSKICDDIERYGRSDLGRSKTVIIEYSQPNIGKVLHVGHLRTTIIGDALANIFEALAYKVIRWNYLGDWGTQFGKLIVQYKNAQARGDMSGAQLMISDIHATTQAYVEFHELEKKNPELEEQARAEFKKLENGDPENHRIWESINKDSIRELRKIYERLGIKEFNEWKGESFFEKDVKLVAKELLEKGIAEKSEGAIVVKLEKQGLPPALIEKSDGTSLYLTRDIVSLEHRLEKYKPVKVLYVVGNEQSLHFEQLFAMAKILGLDSAELVHVKYGLILAGTGKKLSTREGGAEPLANLIDEAEKKAFEIVGMKNPDLSNEKKNSVAGQVGVGAMKYAILKENAHSDIVFDWGKMLDFSGDSAPYLQYTYARLRSILRKAEKAAGGRRQAAGLTNEIEFRIIRKLLEFPEEVKRSSEMLSTSNVANFIYKLAVLANQLYETTPVIKEGDDSRRAALLGLIETAASVIKTGLNVLGIKTPEAI